MNIRVGFGFDVHQLVEGRDLWLGGIKLEHTLGLLGHSDADVLIHAICDALLGALALGDIGKLFPDTSMEFKGIDSKILLRRVCDVVEQKGYKISNIDCTIAMQRPKLRPHIDTMRQTLADVMGVDVDRVSVKATTTEKLGFVGRGEGCEVYAVALLKK